MNKRLLLISYFFPPVGGAGVQRAAKLVKYLPEHGWDVSVLTVSNPSVPLFDASLSADIPADTVICKARTLEPGYALKHAVSAADSDGQPGVSARVKQAAKRWTRMLANAALQPDPQVLWLPAAMKAARRLLHDLPHDAIAATGPPFSSFLLGSRLSTSTGLPLVLDYRDEWSISNAHWENKGQGRMTRLVQQKLEEGVLRRASAVVATTRSSADSLMHTIRRAGSSAVAHAVYNGYDSADLHDFDATPSSDRYRLAYVGTLWNLTSVEPLVEAVERLDARYPDLCSRLEIEFAGRRTAPQDAILSRLERTHCRLIRHGYLEHEQAVELIRNTDSLAVILSDLPEAGRVVPAKLFESMAAQRHILAIAPPGEMRDLLDGHPACDRHSPRDVDAICESLRGEIERKLRRAPLDFRGFDPSRFDRRSQAAEFADVLNTCAATRGADAAVAEERRHVPC